MLPKCRLLLRNVRRKLFYHTQLLAVVLPEIEEFFILSFPEKALNSLQGQIPKNCSLGISNSRTCELGLSMVSDVKFESLFHLLLKASKPKN